MVEDLQVADLVPDDVFEHALGREQQPPVEAHAPVRGARCPAGALAAYVQAAVGATRGLGCAIQTRGDLRACRASVEALQGGTGVPRGNEQPLAVAVHALAAGLEDQL